VDEPLPAYALLLGSFRALAGAYREQMNYEVGAQVALSNDPLAWPSRYDLYTPQGQLRRVAATEGHFALGEFDSAGTYRLRGQHGGPIARAFSVNIPEAHTRLQRMTRDDLDE